MLLFLFSQAPPFTKVHAQAGLRVTHQIHTRAAVLRDQVTPDTCLVYPRASFLWRTWAAWPALKKWAALTRHDEPDRADNEGSECCTPPNHQAATRPKATDTTDAGSRGGPAVASSAPSRKPGSRVWHHCGKNRAVSDGSPQEQPRAPLVFSPPSPPGSRAWKSERPREDPKNGREQKSQPATRPRNQGRHTTGYPPELSVMRNLFLRWPSPPSLVASLWMTWGTLLDPLPPPSLRCCWLLTRTPTYAHHHRLR